MSKIEGKYKNPFVKLDPPQNRIRWGGINFSDNESTHEGLEDGDE